MLNKIPPLIFDESQVGCKIHFLDSGSFTFWRMSKEWAKENNKKDRFEFFEEPEFWDYVDNYAAFVKRYQVAIDYYSNVDVIRHPELTLRVQTYLEETHGLKPVPVVHYPSELKWLSYYMEKGYDYIGIGGLVGSHSQDVCRDWIDRAFDLVCDQPSRLPKVKLHGFGMTSYELLLRYPWYSVDSSYWAKQGAFGRILVPHRRKGEFVFTEQPYSITTSNDSPERKIKGQHYFTMSRAEQEVVEAWLEHVQVPLGQNDEDGSVLELGVTNRYCERKAANLHFFRLLEKSLPKYPWAFKSPHKGRGFDLFNRIKHKGK